MRLYFIQAGTSGPIKIGIAGMPSRRLKDLQVGHYEQLHLLADCPGGIELEADLHVRFALGRLRGEWFRPDTPGLAALIESVRTNPPLAYVSRKRAAVERERLEAKAVVLAENGNWDAAVELMAMSSTEPTVFGEVI